MIKNKPKWWVQRFIYSSFAYAEGLVYPSAEKCIVPTFPIPRHWRRLAGFDYGLSDTAAFIWLAIDPTTGIVYAYQEPRAQMFIEELAKLFLVVLKIFRLAAGFTAPFIDHERSKAVQQRISYDLMI
jgi:hypothetical protein